MFFADIDTVDTVFQVQRFLFANFVQHSFVVADSSWAVLHCRKVAIGNLAVVVRIRAFVDCKAQTYDWLARCLESWTRMALL